VAIFHYSMGERVSRGDVIAAAHRDGCHARFVGLFGPSEAPRWCHGTEHIEEFWKRARAAEKRCDSQVAERIIAALPHELTLAQNISLVRNHAQEFTLEGRVVQVAIHAPEHGEGCNVNARFLIATRGVDENGFKPSKFREQQERYLFRRQYVTRLRERWTAIVNKHLEQNGIAARIDHRSLTAQGIAREPPLHMGLKATARERKGRRTERGDRNREIATRNTERAAITKEIAQLEAEIANLDCAT
jgi:ATP-dependent exoDNAse (exonuclease V) alpha subunit